MMTRRQVVAGLALGSGAGFALFVWWCASTDLSWDMRTVLDWLATCPTWLMALIVFGVPLLGVPLSGPLVALGMRFPFWFALLLVIAVLLVHHLLIFCVRRSAIRERLRRTLLRRGVLRETASERPRLADDISFILAATWIPGLSYVFKVAVTAISSIPFRTYLVVGVLSQSLAAIPYLLLGRAANEIPLGTLGATIFAAVAALWVVKRLVARHRARIARSPSELP